MEDGKPRPGAVELAVLGALTVSRGGRAVAVTGARARGVLGLLARTPGRPVTTAEIVRQVWGFDADEARKPSVRNAVQARVSSLRRVVGPDVLSAVSGGYRLDVPPSAVDAARFEAELARARALRVTGGFAETAGAYDRALAEWAGDAAYADVREVPALAEEGDRLAELRLQALQEAMAVLVEAGRYDTAAAELLRLTRRHPEVEEFWALRMLALYHQDRQADALAVYQDARRVLDTRFGLAPGARLREVEALVLRGDSDRAAGLRYLGPERISRPATSFVGRQHELGTVLELIRHTRMLTLTGPGGVGKTRLALEVAQALVDGCAPPVAHGVAVVDLVPYGQGDDLAGAVVDALSIVAPPAGATGPRRERRPLRLLLDVLRERRMLLVLDNCEHVADEVARLCAAVIGETPATTILATSRQPLDVPGETTYAVAPLAVPGDVDDPAVLAELPAVRLFLDRALAQRPGLAPDAGTVRTVARICRRLDGLPLALELAAVRTRVLGVSDVERLLDDRFRLLDRGPRTAPARHRALESVVAWSYHQLSEEEQRGLARLSVFRGPFTLERVESLWARLGDGGDALAVADQLVTKSLVQAESADGAQVRFRLLETVRLYAANRLAGTGERDRVVRAHVDVYADVAAACAGELKGPGQALAIRRLVPEDANLRAALRNALELRLGDQAHVLVGSLGYVAWMRGGRSPGWDSIARAVELPATDVAARITALAWATHLGSVFGHCREAVRFGELADRLGREHPAAAPDDLAFAQLARAHALHRLARWADGDAVLDHAQRLAMRTGNRWNIAGCAVVRGLGALARGYPADAEAQFVAAAEHYRACEDGWGRQRAALRRAMTREARGDYAGAATLLEEAAELVAGLEPPEIAAPAKVALARMTLLAGDVDAGRRMVEQLSRSGEAVWVEGPSAQLAQCDAVLAELDGRIGDAVRGHLAAGDRLADAGLLAEATESWARVVLLAEPGSTPAAAASAAGERAVAESPDPRIQATAAHLRGLRRDLSDAERAEALAAAAELRARHDLAVPALLRPELSRPVAGPGRR